MDTASASVTSMNRTRTIGADVKWLDLDVLADVTIIAGGRRVDHNLGMWSADCPGEQMIEIRFHHPMPVSRMRVVSSEIERSRTATEEVGEYAVQLEEVSAIRLRIVPSIDGQPAVTQLRVASV
jgi:hypothetical protein